MPNRTTRDYEGPSVAPRVQAALDAALQDEDDIDIDGRWESFVCRFVLTKHCCFGFFKRVYNFFPLFLMITVVVPKCFIKHMCFIVLYFHGHAFFPLEIPKKCFFVLYFLKNVLYFCKLFKWVEYLFQVFISRTVRSERLIFSVWRVLACLLACLYVCGQLFQLLTPGGSPGSDVKYQH